MMFMVGFCHSTNRFLLDTQMNWYRFVHGIWDIHKWFLLFHSFNENKADFLLEKKQGKSLLVESLSSFSFPFRLSGPTKTPKFHAPRFLDFGALHRGVAVPVLRRSGRWPKRWSVEGFAPGGAGGKAVKGEVLCRKKPHNDTVDGSEILLTSWGW